MLQVMLGELAKLRKAIALSSILRVDCRRMLILTSLGTVALCQCESREKEVEGGQPVVKRTTEFEVEAENAKVMIVDHTDLRLEIQLARAASNTTEPGEIRLKDVTVYRELDDGLFHVSLFIGEGTIFNGDDRYIVKEFPDPIRKVRVVEREKAVVVEALDEDGKSLGSIKAQGPFSGIIPPPRQ